MSRFLLDSNCMIATVLPWHAGHAAALGEWRRRIVANDQAVMAAACWSESYSVLTRLPKPGRMMPNEAWAALKANWGSCLTVALGTKEWLQTLEECAAAGITGGLIYDELIAACALKAGVATLITANPRHFQRHAGKLEIRVPGKTV